MSAYSDIIADLFNSQLRDWELAKTNYGLLSKVKTRELDFNGFRILVQFNSERIKSSSAKVDVKSIEARPCFLCNKNRPAEQSGVTFGKDMTVLVNPYPIFQRHLTIPSEQHVDQRIQHNFNEMLSLARAFTDFVIFYNGPECGASAPDHFHFQAGNKGFLPIETDFAKRKYVSLLSGRTDIEVWHWTGYLRGIMTLKGTDQKKLNDAFNHFFKKFSGIQPDKPEPMLNILAYYNSYGWIIHIIPRKLHRPIQFFAEREGQILLSPASVDMGGVIIAPREEDFNKIKSSDIEDIFNQVCLKDDELAILFNDII